MPSDLKNKIRPFYSEFQGYLAQAPSSDNIYASIGDETLWEQYNEALGLLSEVTNNDYSRFLIEPLSDQYGSSYINLSTYKQKLGGLISRLHAEFFSDEPAPFCGMPSTIINQTQQQNVSIQMLLDIQSKIDDALSKSKGDGKKEGFLKKLKSGLKTISNVNDLINQCMKLANEFGLSVQDLNSIWGV